MGKKIDKEFILQFCRDRDEALLSLDRAKIERFMAKYGVEDETTSDEAFWRDIHKARCNNTLLPEGARKESERWLREHGSTPEVW